MLLKNFEEMVMALKEKKKIEGLRILSFRVWHNHVRRCLCKVEGRAALVWNEDGKCHSHLLRLEEQKLDDDEFVERFNYAQVNETNGWRRQPGFDFPG